MTGFQKQEPNLSTNQHDPSTTPSNTPFPVPPSAAVITAALEAWMDVRARKKVPMFWCSTCRTFFKKEYALQLFPELGGVPENTWVCPVCYKKQVFDIPNERL